MWKRSHYFERSKLHGNVRESPLSAVRAAPRRRTRMCSQDSLIRSNTSRISHRSSDASRRHPSFAPELGPIRFRRKRQVRPPTVHEPWIPPPPFTQPRSSPARIEGWASRRLASSLQKDIASSSRAVTKRKESRQLGVSTRKVAMCSIIRWTSPQLEASPPSPKISPSSL